jgi:ABC-2 type transport system permease protein
VTNRALRYTFLIARREFITRVRTRVFIIGTAVIIVGIVGYLAFQILVLSKQTQTATEKVAFVGPVSGFVQPFTAGAKTLDYKIEQVSATDEAGAKRELQQAKVDAVISGELTAPQVFVRDQFPASLQAVLQSLVRQQALNAQLQQAGLDPATVNAKLASATVTVHSVKGTNAQRIEEVVAGFVVAILLYVALITYGTFIAQGVVEEKANRIVEILLSTVRPVQLLIGKVVGIGLVGLFQLTLIGVVAIVLASVTNVFTVPTVAIGVVLIGILWFVLGFFFYAVLFAAAGSLVSRSEEVQGAVMPITGLAVISYFVAISVVTPMFSGAPMTSTGILLAMIPPISPVIMPAGMATGDIAPWQWSLAIVLTLASSAGATWIAARIYSNSVLRLGGRVKLRDALQGERRRAS